MTTTPAAEPTSASHAEAARRSGGAWLLWSGVVLSIAFIAIYFAQVAWARLLITPWYLPIGGTSAALVAVVAASLQPKWWRWVVASVCAAIAGLEWAFLLVLTVLPSYTGPVAAGNSLPEFRASLADGTSINQSYFQQGRPTALVFFQGRWCPFCMTQLTELEANQAEFERVGGDVVVVSIEDLDAAAQTQRDFPHLKVVSDHERSLSDAVDLINRGFAPDGSDCAAPTILLLDGAGKVTWLHRPTRFIARPSATELAARIENGN